MTTADAVRGWLGIGRLLALGGAADGTWLTERAAREVLRRAAAGVPGAVLSRVRLSLVDPERAQGPLVPPPPGALPAGPLRIEAECAGTDWTRPLPEPAAALRTALLTAATDVLDLPAVEADIRVTDVADPREAGPHPEPEPATGTRRPGTEGDSATGGPVGRVTAAVVAVPGVARLTTVLGPAVSVGADRARVEIAVAAGHRPLAVARAVRAAASAELPADRPLAVLITEVAV
ncbi:hypothetical protein [Streptomyces yaizuensis]|uniref:Nucleopolyhedrovirus P10 family protein n=1 Tax=Streptomyces yaizuensis TaxID=2989713 RepID=A0ABQ5P7V9_9ACTN|nr:hypothetical protein [Streptomyces sp. YSPA8]GLF98686.1 nucleopolyhedrovirus P10 family protein [Streptomyces sp. YSPA8]